MTARMTRDGGSDVAMDILDYGTCILDMYRSYVAMARDGANGMGPVDECPCCGCSLSRHSIGERKGCDDYMAQCAKEGR
jgi:hypothetical protein